MDILNFLTRRTEKQDINNPAKAIIHAVFEWKKFLPAMLERDASANDFDSVDEFITFLAVKGKADEYIAKTHLDLVKDLISQPIIQEAIIDVRTTIIDRLKIKDEETKSYVHDIIFRRILLIGDFTISLPPLREHYGNRINQKKADAIEELTKLILGLPGISS